jgi:RNA-directed DNA polymerase
MLGALETGVRGGKWHSLYDKVYGLSNLKAAWQRVKANQGGGGVDEMSTADFDKDADVRLEKLSEALRTNVYKPLPVRRTYIPKLGSSEKRPLGIPTIIDRIVQTAVRNVIEPIFEQEFDPCSYGFRPKLGCQNALGEVERLLAAGSVHVVDVDVRKYFDTIPHQGLMNEVAKRIADGRVLDLIEAYLHQGVLEEMTLWMPETGTPQGAVISPLLAVYLPRSMWPCGKQGSRLCVTPTTWWCSAGPGKRPKRRWASSVSYSKCEDCNCIPTRPASRT